jgi:transaldolase
VNRLQLLHDAGVSIWLDTLSRELLETGEFERLVRDYAVTGATSNPTIFAKAITGSDRYDDQLKVAVEAGKTDAQELFFELGLEDIRRAAAILRPAYDQSAGTDGFVSFECTPDLADDTEATIEQALELWGRLDRPNVMIKVPATAAGVPAIEELTAAGVNVNVTLLFSVSRVDAKADAVLAPDSPLRGQIAIANAHRGYGLYLERFGGERWEGLRRRGAAPQRPLWASTGTKDPTHPDVLYVERLIAPGVVNTMPEKTLHAFADHGDVPRALDADPAEAKRQIAQAADAGIDLAALTAELEREGVRSFCDSYHELLGCIDTRLAALASGTTRA